MTHFKYNIIAALLLSSTLAGCNDFLDVKPLNEIVLDNYWTEKADVESVVYSCYSGLQTGDCMQRMFIWGDSRSDDVVYSKSGNNINLRQVIEENILETNPLVNWVSLYQVINRCNTVIYYAPIVAEKDPNYTDSEKRANIAEATWIRSLCYFYLARTFRDVPYTAKPSLDDTNIDEDYRIAPTPFKELLAQLAQDLEAVKDDALRYYPPMDSRNTKITNPYNTSRVTICAMYALLADIYLWMDEYQKCVDCTQKVFDYKMALYEEIKEEYPTDVRDIRLYETKYPLIMEMISGSATAGNAYSQIFGEGNSFESIFELYFHSGTSASNPLASGNNSFFFSSSTNGLCNAYTELTTGVYAGTNKLFNFTDNRVAEYFKTSQTQVTINKFYYESVSFKPTKVSGTEVVPDGRQNNGYSNWIFYRLTDVMLMRAEALAELGSDENLAEAFELVSAVYNRANNLEEGDALGLKADNYSDQESMRQLVRDERHRELMFEGKRWFDLVRYALRDGRNDELISCVISKQEKNSNKIRIQLQQRDALFWPYAESEIDLNPHLVQNSAYITNETSAK